MVLVSNARDNHVENPNPVFGVWELGVVIKQLPVYRMKAHAKSYCVV